MTSPLRALPDSVAQMDGLDPVADAVGNTLSPALSSPAVKDALSGTWLGHPAHPMLTDVPVGTWTAAMILDVLGGERMEDAATTLVGIGCAAAVPTALTGLSDWADTEGPTRRIGTVHGAGNVTALGLFAASYLARRRQRHGVGVVLGFLGGAVATLTAYLGGHLVYGKGVGVDVTAFQKGPDRWKQVLDAADVAEGKPVSAEAGDVPIVVFRRNGRLSALANRCTHRGGPLDEGELTEEGIVCPWHGSCFRIEDGAILRGPATAPQPSFEVRQHAGKIEVRAKDRDG
jgi:nitrite reductase/ring-hydroxylating ferredoxin subunit/uncharacterized membrane protein